MVIRVQPQRPSFKPIPYQRTSHRRGIPSWLVIFTIGIVIGVMGVMAGLTITVPSTNGAKPGRNLLKEMKL